MSEKVHFFSTGFRGKSFSKPLSEFGKQKVEISKMRGQLFVDNMVIIENKNVPQWLLDSSNEAYHSAEHGYYTDTQVFYYKFVNSVTGETAYLSGDVPEKDRRFGLGDIDFIRDYASSRRRAVGTRNAVSKDDLAQSIFVELDLNDTSISEYKAIQESGESIGNEEHWDLYIAFQKMETENIPQGIFDKNNWKFANTTALDPVYIDYGYNPSSIKVSSSSYSDDIENGDILAVLTAIDPDPNDSHEFSLYALNDYSDVLEIDADKVKVKDASRLSALESIPIILYATDSKGLSQRLSFTFTKSKANKKPIDLSVSSTTFNENIPANSLIANLSTSDPDLDDVHTYSLISGDGDTDNEQFAIAGKELKIKASPDYEAQSSYSIRIQTQDSGGLTFEKSFSFSINDLDEQPSSVFTVQDAGSLVAERGSDLVIPDGYTAIDDYAFEGVELTSISLPQSLESIGRMAFYGANLSSLLIPKNIVAIKELAFTRNPLTSLVLPTNLTSVQVSSFDRLNLLKDGEHSTDFVCVYAANGWYTEDISFDVAGKNRFSDVIQDRRTEGELAQSPILVLELSNLSNGDAFFLHDTYSDYPESFETTKDAWGRDYTARAQNLLDIFARDGDDLIDLSTTETREIHGGVKRSGGGVKGVYGGSGDDVILGSDGAVFGEEGNDTFISHHSAVMTGGSGDDIFGFLATPSMQAEPTALNSEPVHSITDFETGSDSIRFYMSSELEQTGSLQPGNSDHITKTAEGDIEWMYFHAGQTSKTITVKMNDQSWSMDDIEFITYTPVTPELV